MSWVCCDKDGLPPAGILSVISGKGGVEAELGCVGTIAVSESWGKGETELILPPSPMILQLAFPIRLHLESSFLFTSASLVVHSLS